MVKLDMNQHKRTQKNYSLRSRYFLIASIISLLLIVSSVIAGLSISSVNQRNAHALKLKDDISAVIIRVRNALWKADTAISAMLITPKEKHEKQIKDNILNAGRQLTLLYKRYKPENAEIKIAFENLEKDLKHYGEQAFLLVEKRHDPNWVYPMLPLISNYLLRSNQTFESSATIALSEIEASHERGYGSELYHRIDEIKDLWRLKTLEFRATVIRFAGLNRRDILPAEENIELLHKLIQSKLKALVRDLDQYEPEIETIDAVENMVEVSDTWLGNYNEFKKIRGSQVWRADIYFLQKNVQPVQDRVISDLNQLEQSVINWSRLKTEAVKNAANMLILELWLLSIIAFAFVILIYFMLDRSVLSPISRIASLLTYESGNLERISLPVKGSREVKILIDSFNGLRNQIHQRQMALEHQALHDELTGLPNRALLIDRLNNAISQAKRSETHVALMLMDLDRFKEINDTLGHPVGDKVLQIISKRLATFIRTSDTIARLGGDEFAIIAPNCSKAQADKLVAKITGIVDQVIPVEKQNLYVGSSVGVTMFPENGNDAQTLIRHADIAMYQAKNNNRQYLFYDNSFDEMTVNNLGLLADLRRELSNKSNNIQLYYQPKINLFSREVVGVEALLRWEHDTLGFVSPEQIINMAEQAGLIGELSSRVLEQAISDCKRWVNEGNEISVAINLSAWNLQDPDLPLTIDMLLEKYALASSMVSLEITESVVMNDPVRAREVMNALSEMGMELVIDDYGTGFSSLAYLKLLPVRVLKIDKSFVLDMLNNDNDRIIVKSTIDLAHNLGLSVVAEGVESQEVSMWLRQQKCDLAQGYYFARPIPADEFNIWLKDYRLKQAQ